MLKLSSPAANANVCQGQDKVKKAVDATKNLITQKDGDDEDDEPCNP